MYFRADHNILARSNALQTTLNNKQHSRMFHNCTHLALAGVLLYLSAATSATDNNLPTFTVFYCAPVDIIDLVVVRSPRRQGDEAEELRLKPNPYGAKRICSDFTTTTSSTICEKFIYYDDLGYFTGEIGAEPTHLQEITITIGDLPPLEVSIDYMRLLTV
jgi:hypothetical protein